MLSTSLLPHEITHLLVALLLGFIVFWKSRSLKLIIILFIVTFLVDLDHIYDYFHFTGNLSFWEYFSKIDVFSTSQQAFILAHSWELVIILGGWGWRRRQSAVLVASLALAGHLLVDQLTWTENLLAYFLALRAINQFSLVWFDNLCCGF